MNIKKVKQNDEDEELLHLTKLLTDIHKEYFTVSESSVIDILKKKKKILNGLRFYTTNPKLKSKIEDYGGTLVDDLSLTNYALISKNEEIDLEAYESSHTVVLDEMYIYECVYKLRKISVEKYILYDFSGDDKLIDEIFDNI